MITLVVYLVIVMGLIVSVGWSVLTYQRSSEVVSLAQRNAARMDQVASLVRANLRPVEFAGKMRAPLGERTSQPIQPAGAFSQAEGKFVATNPNEQVCADERDAVLAGTAPSPAFAQRCYRMTLPRWVVADTKTPWGADYGYCPYSVDAISSSPPALVQSTDAIVRPGESQAYAARTVLNRGRPFVLQSDNQPIQVIDGSVVRTSSVAEQGVVGFVVAPPPNNRGSAPLCTEIVLRDGAWIVQGPNGTGPTIAGNVVPIYMQGVGVGSAAVQDDVVIHAASVASGAGTGDTAADPIAFRDLLDLWHLTPWQSATFVVAPGTYTFGPADLVPGSDSVSRLNLRSDKPGRSLRIVSPGGGATIASASGGTDLVVGVDARFENVSLAAGVRLRAVDGARVQVTGGGLGAVRVDGGDLDLWGARVAYDGSFGSNSAIDLTSGRLRLSGGAATIGNVPSGGAGVNMLGGDLVLDGTDLSIAGAAGAMSIATPEPGRVSSVPKSSGGLPVVAITGPGGTVASPVEKEVLASQQCASGADGTFTCAAVCPATTVGSRVAASGSCHAEPIDEGHPIPPSLVRTSRHDLLTKAYADVGTWSCTWRSGVTVTPGSIPNTVNLQSSTMPSTRVEARCLSNVTLVAPASPPPS